jgi:enoyl-CoA hydratase/carnithine racemase
VADPQEADPDRESVVVEVDRGVATFTLNRPERRNTWSPGMERRYVELLREADVDPAIRVGVLTGRGRTFCPGVDTGRLDTLVGKPFDLTGRMSPTSALGLRKPIIAAINGACAGMGLVQALMCDVRVLERGARIATAFARRGLAAEYGIAYLLPRLIGVERALDLLLSGRTIEADEALELGLVSRVVDAGESLAAAQEYAHQLADYSSPISMAFVKHQVWSSLDQSLDEVMSSTYRSMSAAVAGQDFREGLDSFVEKRAPSFAPLSDDVRPERVTGVSIASAFRVLASDGQAPMER